MGAELKHAKARGHERSRRRHQERQYGPMQADGQMCICVRAQIEHVPQPEERWHDGHGKDHGLLDWNRHFENDPGNDKSGEKQRQDQGGQKNPRKVSAKIGMGIHSVLFLGGRTRRRFTDSKEARGSTPERRRRKPLARPAAPNQAMPRKRGAAIRVWHRAAATSRATGRAQVLARLRPAAAPVARVASCGADRVHSWCNPLGCQVLSQQSKRSKDAQFVGGD